MNKKVMLRFREDIPARLEDALVDFGFIFFGRRKGHWIMYEKVMIPENNTDKAVLSAGVQKTLTRRLNSVVDSYVDPYSNIPAIRSRCMTIADSLPKDQRDWVVNWIETTVDDESFTPPWESEDGIIDVDFEDEPCMGSC